MKTSWICLLPCAAIAAAQTTAASAARDGRALLAGIVAAVRQNVDRLPNYTCTMTVDRYQRLIRSNKTELLDRVRLEVATVGDRELYAWPGSKRFEERPIHDLVRSGSISTGEFGLFLQTVFLAGVARFQYAGLESLNGRAVHHFLYSVPRSRSKYFIRFPGVKDHVGFSGSTWNDAETLDLVRLEVNIDEIPKELPLSAGHLVIDYARVSVGGGSFLLPHAVDNSFTMEGVEARNHTTYSACREYTTESTISFDKVPATGPQPLAASTALVAIPPGIEIESRLETVLDAARLATGDPFEAVVTKPVRHKRELLAPRGAKIRGHISRVVRIDTPYTCVGVELHPESIEFEGREGPFDAQNAPSMANDFPRPGTRACLVSAGPGTAMLRFYSSRFHIAAGYPIVWETLGSARDRRP